jgi:hypothetical protein
MTNNLLSLTPKETYVEFSLRNLNSSKAAVEQQWRAIKNLNFIKLY